MAIRSLVVWPRAESTATTRLPASRWATIRWAARLIRWASATDVPPNFITTVGGRRLRTGRYGRIPSSRSYRAPAGERAAQRELVGVLEVGADWQSAGEPRDRDPGALAQAPRDMQRRRLARGGRVGRDHDLAQPPFSTRSYSSAIFRSSGSTPSIGERAPPSTW